MKAGLTWLWPSPEEGERQTWCGGPQAGDLVIEVGTETDTTGQAGALDAGSQFGSRL